MNYAGQHIRQGFLRVSFTNSHLWPHLLRSNHSCWSSRAAHKPACHSVLTTTIGRVRKAPSSLQDFALHVPRNGAHQPVFVPPHPCACLVRPTDTQTPLVLSGPPNSNPPHGNLVIQSFKMELRPTFLDYITAGIEISFMVAVDFTGSNGDPQNTSSLHYMDPTGVWVCCGRVG